MADADSLTLMLLFSVKANSKGGKPIRFFISEVFRLRLVIGRTIIFRKIVPPIKNDIDKIAINF